MHEKSRTGALVYRLPFAAEQYPCGSQPLCTKRSTAAMAGGSRSFQQIPGVKVSLRHALSNHVGVELNSYYVWADSCQTLYRAADTRRECSRVLQSKGISVGGELGTRLLKRWYSGALAAGFYYENLGHRDSDNDIQSGNVPVSGLRCDSHRMCIASVLMVLLVCAAHWPTPIRITRSNGCNILAHSGWASCVSTSDTVSVCRAWGCSADAG